MASEYSEEEYEKIMDLTEDWYHDFEMDDFFLNLSPQNQENAGFVINCFAQYMYNYQGVTPQKWNLKDMKNVCTDVMPRKISAEAETFEAIVPVLEAFFRFLCKKDLVPNAKHLAEQVTSLSSTIIKNANNPRSWGMAKSITMMAKKAGIDFDNVGAINSLLQSDQEIGKQIVARTGLLSHIGNKMVPYTNKNKTRVNEKCPCGSGKKYKKCCIDKVVETTAPNP